MLFLDMDSGSIDGVVGIRVVVGCCWDIAIGVAGHDRGDLVLDTHCSGVGMCAGVGGTVSRWR